MILRIHPTSPTLWCASVAVLVLLGTAARGASGDENWDDRFSQPIQAHGMVRQITAGASGVYAAGRFDAAGGVPATNIARWDGTNWTPLAGDLTGLIYDLAVRGSELFASGQLHLGGQTNTVVLARWDGTNWTAWENGLLWCWTLLADDEILYVGGGRTNALGEWQTVVMECLGTNCAVIGSTTNTTLMSLAKRGSDLFVAGWLDSIGGVAVTNLARWDGTNWSEAGGGVGTPGPLQSVTLAADDRWLYVAGRFETAGGLSLTNLARWDGTNWLAMAEGLSFPTNGGIASLVAGGGCVYASGIFEPGQPRKGHNLARWDGNQWTALPWEARIYPALAADATGLYVGGDFAQLDGVAVHGIAHWNGTNWSDLAGGLTERGSVETLSIQGSDILVGGRFHRIGGVEASNLARWDGTNWSALGWGTDGPVATIFATGQVLYVAGAFTRAGGSPAWGAAQFDGTVWSALEGGVDFAPSCFAMFGTNLIAGGLKNQPDGIPAGPTPRPGSGGDVLCRWTGAGWQAILGRELGWSIGRLAGLAVTDSRLYAAGSMSPFDPQAPNQLYPSHPLLEWDGVSWTPVPVDERYGLGGSPAAVLADGGSVYVGLSTTVLVMPSLQPRTQVVLARWDGTDWWRISGPTFPNVSAMALLHGDVFIGSRTDPRGIIRWDGVEWRELGSGVNENVHALASLGSDIFAGGRFAQAGTNVAHGFAVWHEPAPEPRLRISRTGERALISWPAALTGFVLEETTRLESLLWTEVEQPPTLSGSRNVVTNAIYPSPWAPWLPRPATNKFFRLVQPGP